jgi:tetrahydromethanopterin S-methyltransferase subunit D
MSGSSGMVSQLRMIMGAGLVECGRASHDAHISESRYGAPGTRRHKCPTVVFLFGGMRCGPHGCVSSVYYDSRGEDEQP